MSVVLSARVPESVARGFDVGRSALLHQLIREAAGSELTEAAPTHSRRDALRLMVRLAARDAAHVQEQSARMGLPKSSWVAALVTAHARGSPRFSRPDELAVIGVYGELRRIGVNVNQIARRLNTAATEGLRLDTQLNTIEDLREEVRAHIAALSEAFGGNLAYWKTEL